MTNRDLIETVRVIDEDYEFYRDQMNVNFPRSFACIRLPIDDDWPLCMAADEERVKAGYPASFSGKPDADAAAWWNFSIELYDDIDGIKVANAIGAEVCYSEEEDNGWVYYIDLTDQQREMLLPILNQQCWRVFGMSLKQMFAIANKDLFGEEAV